MAKYFPFVKTKTVTKVVTVGSGAEVTTNKIRIDWRETVSSMKDTVRLALGTANSFRATTTDSLVLIVKAAETAAFRVSDKIVMVAKTVESARAITTHYIGLGVKDRAKYLTSLYLATNVTEKARFTATPALFNTISSYVNPLNTKEAPPVVSPLIHERSIGPEVGHEFSGVGQLFGDTIVSNTANVNNPEFALTSAFSRFATVSVESSGVGGTTSNTETFDLTMTIEDVDLSQLFQTIDLANVYLERAGEVSGVSVGGTGFIDAYWGFGDGPMTFFGRGEWQTGVPLATASNGRTITADIANDWDLVNDVRLRFVGSVTSGVGVGATSTAKMARGSILINASGTA